MPTQEAVIATQEANQPQEEAKRERSTIQFPYLPLDDAVAIAKGVHAVSGGTCQVDQLAAHLNQSAASSMFKLRLSTARIFNLVTYSQGTVTLTPLGVRMCDPQREQAARADAFLAVPLYSRVHEQFKGVNLPPPSGLETAMVNMGVAPKQKDSARQVFQRSATQAGFFAYGPNRLVYPPTRSSAGAAASEVNPAPGEVENVQEKPTKKNGNDGGSSRHPLIEGLIKTLKNLPPEDSKWPIEARRKWLQTAANIFDLVYSGEDGSLLMIEIKNSAK